MDEIYKVGGAQAIAALAFGTESIPKVDKIVGPGNIYVALAKKAVYGHVSIDSIAGPSEILVLADETANPRYVAADLLSQAEHDEMASAILVTTSRQLAEQVSARGGRLSAEAFPERDHSKNPWKITAIFWWLRTMEEAIETANEIASEHLEIVTRESLRGDDEDQKCGGHLPGRIQQRAPGRLLRGPEPCAAHQRNREVFLALERGRFYQEIQHYLLFQGSPGDCTRGYRSPSRRRSS